MIGYCSRHRPWIDEYSTHIIYDRNIIDQSRKEYLRISQYGLLYFGLYLRCLINLPAGINLFILFNSIVPRKIVKG